MHKTNHPVFDNSRMPKYLQLYEVLKQDIIKGLWKNEEKLPTIADFMDKYALGRVTVRQALDLLSKENYVHSQRGRGTFVTFDYSKEKKLEVKTSLSDLISGFRSDKPIMTTLFEGKSIPQPAQDINPDELADNYVYMKRVHANDAIKYCLISLYIASNIYQLAKNDFQNKLVIPVLYDLSEVNITNAKQVLTIQRADAEFAELIGVDIGSPVALVRRKIYSNERLIYLADVLYRGDYININMDLMS